MRNIEEIAHSIGLTVNNFNQLQQVFRNNGPHHAGHRFFSPATLAALVEAETVEMMERCKDSITGHWIESDYCWETTKNLSLLFQWTLPKDTLLYICNEHLDVCETALARFTQENENAVDDLKGYYFADVEALVSFVFKIVMESTFTNSIND